MGLSSKRLSEVMSTSSAQERLEALCRELMVGDGVQFPQVMAGNVTNIMDLRKLGLARRKGKGAEQHWYVSPYIFVFLMLELDPESYAKVIIWVSDGLFEKRNLAGDAYLKMASSLNKMLGPVENFHPFIARVAKGVNFIVFNNHYEGIRNNATKEQMNEIFEIEVELRFAMDKGLVKTYEGLIRMIGEMYKEKWDLASRLLAGMK